MYLKSWRGRRNGVLTPTPYHCHLHINLDNVHDLKANFVHNSLDLNLNQFHHCRVLCLSYENPSICCDVSGLCITFILVCRFTANYSIIRLRTSSNAVVEFQVPVGIPESNDVYFLGIHFLSVLPKSNTNGWTIFRFHEIKSFLY